MFNTYFIGYKFSGFRLALLKFPQREERLNVELLSTGNSPPENLYPLDEIL
jgi:hypothetical protein